MKFEMSNNYNSKIHNDMNNMYNITFNLSLLEENNYIYKRCKDNFSKLYSHELTFDLYKNFVEHVRIDKNRIHIREVNDFLLYIYFMYDDVIYQVKFNIIDELIKSFMYLDRKICRDNKLKRKNYIAGKNNF